MAKTKLCHKITLQKAFLKSCTDAGGKAEILNNYNIEAIKPRSYSEVFEDTCKAPYRFFGAANTKVGFVSFFDSIFSPQKIDTLYILDGGPGCGKSTLMKNIASRCEKKGYLVERIFCSSSPTSLDGVILPEKRVAVIDGTPPHTYTPKLAGAREITINLGVAWDTKALSERRETISSLAASKAQNYKKAYIYLHAANLLKNEQFEADLSHVLFDKLHKNVSLVASKELSGVTENSEFCPDIRLSRAISCKGNIYFDSFSRMAQKTYLVTDFKGLSDLWFAALFEIAKKKKSKITVSFSPEDTKIIDGIYFHREKCAFTKYAADFDKNINCARFADKEQFSVSSRHHSFVEKSRNTLLCESYSALFSAGNFRQMPGMSLLLQDLSCKIIDKYFLK